jgi:putative FmdB family regulatory protein
MGRELKFAARFGVVHRMPTYEYECDKCGKVFDLFQPMTESPRKKLRSTDPKPCKCNTTVTRRISTGGGLIFKGSGFYLTDYRSESYKEAAKADSGEKKGDEGKTTDAKPADAKSETKTSDTKTETKSSHSTAAAQPDKPAKKKPKSK